MAMDAKQAKLYRWVLNMHKRIEATLDSEWEELPVGPDGVVSLKSKIEYIMEQHYPKRHIRWSALPEEERKTFLDYIAEYMPIAVQRESELQDEGVEEEPYEYEGDRGCQFCGDGGCPSCRPSWFY